MFQGPFEEQRQCGYEDVGLHPLVLLMEDGATLDDVLKFAEAPFHRGQFLVSRNRFDGGDRRVVGLENVLALMTHLGLELVGVFKEAELPWARNLPGVITIAMVL